MRCIDIMYVDVHYMIWCKGVVSYKGRRNEEAIAKCGEGAELERMWTVEIYLFADNTLPGLWWKTINFINDWQLMLLVTTVFSGRLDSPEQIRSATDSELLTLL